MDRNDDCEVREVLERLARLISDEFFADFTAVYNPDFPDEIDVQYGADRGEQYGVTAFYLRVVKPV